MSLSHAILEKIMDGVTVGVAVLITAAKASYMPKRETQEVIAALFNGAMVVPLLTLFATVFSNQVVEYVAHTTQVPTALAAGAALIFVIKELTK